MISKFLDWFLMITIFFVLILVVNNNLRHIYKEVTLPNKMLTQYEEQYNCLSTGGELTLLKNKSNFKIRCEWIIK